MAEFEVPFEIIRFNNGNRKIGLSTMCTDYEIIGLNENGVQSIMKVWDILYMDIEEFTNMLFFCQSDTCRCKISRDDCSCYARQFHRLPLFAIIGSSSYVIQDLFESNINNPRQQHTFLLDNTRDITSMRIRLLFSDVDAVASRTDLIFSLHMMNTEVSFNPDIYDIAIPLNMIIISDETDNLTYIIDTPDLLNTRYNRVWAIVSLAPTSAVSNMFLDIAKVTFNVTADLTVIYDTA